MKKILLVLLLLIFTKNTMAYNSWLSYEDPYKQQSVQGQFNPTGSAQQQLMPDYSSQQNVLGASTQQSTPEPTQQPSSGGGGGGVNLSTMGGQDRNAWAISQGFTGYEDYENNRGNQGGGQSEVDKLADQARGNINTGYDQYFAGLDEQLNTDLPTQRTAQEGMVGSQLSSGMGTLEGQKTEGLADLNVERRKTESGQAKSLQDLAENIRGLFQAGKVNLGSRGAGDSSAADQYAYAIAKMGTKSRGAVLAQTKEIQTQINDKEFKLKNIYNTSIKELQASTDQKNYEIANWFSQAQQQIKDMKAQGQLGQGQDLASLSQQALTMAQNKLMIAQTDAKDRRNALDSWAMSNSENITQLKGNLAKVSQYQAPGVNTPGLQGLSSPTGGNTGWNMQGMGYSTDEDKYLT